MAKLLKLRRGTTSQHSSFTGAEGEVTVDTDKESLVVHNGSTAGGFPIARADGTGVTNFTITGELDAATLDISGNADIDGTLEADAYTVDGTALNEYIADTVGSMVTSNTETGITVTYEDGDNTLDFAVGTLNQNTTGTSGGLTGTPDVTVGVVTAGSLDISGNADIDGTLEADAYTVNGTALDTHIAGVTVTNATNAAGLTGTPNITVGDVTAASLDISGNADIDGTLEADAYTVNGTALNEYIADTIGSMVTGNTETNITVTYEDSDNTLDFVIGTLNQNTSGTAAGLSGTPNITVGDVTAASLDISGDADIDGTLEADAYTVNGTALSEYIADTVGAMVGSNTESGITVTYQDSDNTIDFSVGTLNQNTSGTAAGLSGTPDITVDDVVAASLDISGDADIDGTLEADAYTVNGTSLAEYISDTVGAMVGGNSESGITVTYQDSDNTIDFSVGTLNQNTTGTAGGLSGSPNITVGTIGCGAITGTSTVSDSKGNVRSIPLNNKTSAYTLVAADAGKAIYISTGGVTVNNSLFSAGDAVTIINNSGSDQTITQGSGVTMYNTGDAATGNRTLAGRGMATIWFQAAATAYISGSGLS